MADIDIKVVQRIHKLLNLARDGGATEAEASLAMEHAQRMMAEHNLSIATLEQSGGGSADVRLKDRNDKNLMYPWKRQLLDTIANVNFCFLSIRYESTRSGQQIAKGYDIIGRASNVAAVKNMFEYLLATIERLVVAEVGTSPQDRYTRYSHSFRLGCSGRLRERLTERHEQVLAEQERAAREQKARASHPGAAPGNALVVVLRDYAQTEEDLNNDMKWGYEPGTTAQRRLAQEQRNRAYEIEAAAKRREIETRMQELMAGGESYDRAWYLARGYDAKTVDKLLKPETEAQKRKREARDERYAQQQRDKEWRAAQKIDWRGYASGQARAEDVGLHDQVDACHNPKLAR